MDYKEAITDTAVSDLDALLAARRSMSEESKALLLPVDYESVAGELEALMQKEIEYLGGYAKMITESFQPGGGALNEVISEIMEEIASGLRGRATYLKSNLQIVELSKVRPK